LDADRKYNSDFQDRLAKTLASELTKSTTRVMEMTINSEMQRTVIPTLESLTRNEVKAALGSQIAKGITESIHNSLPVEIEKASHAAGRFQSYDANVHRCRHPAH
jgi:hypothetical protein